MPKMPKPTNRVSILRVSEHDTYDVRDTEFDDRWPSFVASPKTEKYWNMGKNRPARAYSSVTQPFFPLDSDLRETSDVIDVVYSPRSYDRNKVEKWGMIVSDESIFPIGLHSPTQQDYDDATRQARVAGVIDALSSEGDKERRGEMQPWVKSLMLPLGIALLVGVAILAYMLITRDAVGAVTSAISQDTATTTGELISVEEPDVQ